MKDTRITGADMPEFVGEIIDIFEDFLEDKGVTIPNDDRTYAIQMGEPEDTLAIIYGMDYGELQSAIEATLVQWGLATADKEE